MKHYLNRKPFMSENSKKIVINLDKLESTDALERENLIFQEQYDLLVKKIRRKAKENKKRFEKKECGKHKKQNDEERGVPSCFFIDGSRGSGKSTLMRAVREKLIECEGDDEVLYPLADVDPTELGKGENFFLYLLSRIYRLLDERFKKNDICDEKVGQIREAMEALRKMSGGLQVLMDSDGALKESDNPDFFLEKCVDKCADSSLLRKKLCELLGNVAKIVGKEIFLVTIDDADLNFSKCEDVLEYVRKYMQTPRLIFLFAGDMQLYAHVVRGIQMKSFGKTLLKYDETHAAHREQMLDHLEEQYLLKIFPAENRLNLGCFVSLLRNASSVELRFEEEWQEQKKTTLSAFLNHYLGQVADQPSMAIVKGFLGKLPLRSVLLLLRYWYRASKEDNLSYEKISSGVQRIALQPLIKYGVEYASLQSADMATVLRALFRFFQQEVSVEKDLSLKPIGRDLGALLVCFYFSTLVAETTRSLHEKIAYFMTLHPNWNTVCALLKKGLDEYNNNESIKKNVVDQQLYFLEGDDYVAWSARSCACLAPSVESGSNRKRRFGGGTIRLMKKPLKRNPEKGTVDKISFAQLHGQLSSFEKDSDNATILCKLAVLHSICELKEGRELGYYLSVYGLLSCAADLLKTGWERFGNVALSDKPMDEGQISNDLIEMLKPSVMEKFRKLAAPPLSARLSFFDAGDIDYSDDLEEDSNFYSVSEIDDEILTEISRWIVRYSRVSSCNSSMDLDKLWVGFESRYSKYEEEFSLEYSLPDKQARAGSLFRRYMDAFEQALAGVGRETSSAPFACLSQAIKEFPLWNALKTMLDNEESEFSKLLNSVNIGPLLDKSLVAIVNEAKENLKSAEQRVEDSLKRKEECKRALQATENAIRPLRAEKARAKKSFNDVDRKIDKRNKEVFAFDSRLKELYQIEKRIEEQKSIYEKLLNKNLGLRNEKEKDKKKLADEIAAAREDAEKKKTQANESRRSLNQLRLLHKSHPSEEDARAYEKSLTMAILMLKAAEEKEQLSKDYLSRLLAKLKELERELSNIQRELNTLDKNMKAQKTLEEKVNKEKTQLQKKRNDAQLALDEARREKLDLSDMLKNLESRYEMAHKEKLEALKKIDIAQGTYEQALREKEEAQKHLEAVKS